MLDMKTTMVGFVLGIGLQLFIIMVLWHQHSSLYKGLHLWVFSYLSIFVAFCSIVVFKISNLPSVIISINAFSLGGLIILVFGLEQFFEIENSWRINILLFAIVIVLTIYFTYIDPSLNGRIANTAFGNFIIWIQCAWLVFYRVKPSFRIVGRQIGIFSLLLAFTALFRGAMSLKIDLGLDFFKTPALIIGSFLLAQILFFRFTSSPILLVSRRLNADLECDI